MRRAVLLFSFLGLLVPSVAAAAPADASSAPALGVRVAGCDVGADVERRAAEFTGSMPAAAGAAVLAMRFELEQRRGSLWKAVSPVGFSRYERSEPGAAGFVYAKRVERLAAGVSYRVTVRFRWTAADGAVVKRAMRRSGACRQPDLRPDLFIAGLTSGELVGDGRARYVVDVRNSGRTAAGGTLRVGLVVGGTTLLPRTLAGLDADGVGSVVFEGPVCRPGETVRALVDARDGLEDADEADNVLELECPGA